MFDHASACTVQACPFVSDCTAISSSVLAYSRNKNAVTAAERAQISVDDLTDAVIGLGAVRLVPACTRLGGDPEYSTTYQTRWGRATLHYLQRGNATMQVSDLVRMFEYH